MTQRTPLAELLTLVSEYLSEGDSKNAVEQLIAIREAGFATSGLERHVALLNASPGDITATRAWVDKVLARVEAEGDSSFSHEGLAEGSIMDFIGAAADDLFGSDDLFGDDSSSSRSNSFAAEASTRRVAPEDTQRLRESSEGSDDVPSLKDRLRITANKFRIPKVSKASPMEAAPENLRETRPTGETVPADKQTKPFGAPSYPDARLDQPTMSSRSVTPLQAVPVAQRQSGDERDLDPDDDIGSAGIPEVTPNVFNRGQETRIAPSAMPPASADDDDFDFDLGFESKPATFGPSTAAAEKDEFTFDLGLSPPKQETLKASDSEFELEFTASPPTKQVNTARSSDGFDFDFTGGGELEDTAVKTKPTGSDKGGSAQTAIPHPGRNHQPTPLATTKDALGEDEFFELADSMSSEVNNPYRGEPITRGAPSRTNPFNRDNPTGVLPSEASFVLEDLGSPESSVVGPSTNMSAILLEARRMYERGEFSAALDICNKVMSRHEGHDEANQLRLNIEGELVRSYIERLGSLNRIPRVIIDMSDVGTMNLDHRAGFILSQIDGMSSYEDLLELASMARHEALKLFVRLLDVGATSHE